MVRPERRGPGRLVALLPSSCSQRSTNRSRQTSAGPDTRYWYAVFAFRPVWLYTVAVPLCSGSAPVHSVSPFDDHST